MIANADTSASSASAIHQAADVHASAQSTYAKNASTVGSPPLLKTGSAEVSGTMFVTRSSDTITRWTPFLEAQFQQLVALRADRKATPHDMERLDHIRKIRQRIKSPVSAAQILRDFKARELQKQALDAVKAYVLFLKNT